MLYIHASFLYATIINPRLKNPVLDFKILILLQLHSTSSCYSFVSFCFFHSLRSLPSLAAFFIYNFVAWLLTRESEYYCLVFLCFTYNVPTGLCFKYHMGCCFLRLAKKDSVFQ
jgi:hypothetical protein